MPGYLSHYLFSIGTAKRLQGSKAYPMLLKYKKAFCLGGEGPDIFLYYVPCYLHKQSLGHRLHKSKSKELFYYGLQNIISRKTQKEKDVLYAYLCGLFCHYTLDTIAHPYVEAFANPTNDKAKKSLNSYRHCSLETVLDTNLLFKYLKRFPSEQDYFSITKPSKSDRQLIATFLSSTCNKVYEKELDYHMTTSKQMYHAVSLFPYLARCLQDRLGLKKPISLTLEKLLHLPYRPSCVISTDELQIDRDVLNLSHQQWASPFKPTKIRTESFVELFKVAMDTAYKRCQILYSILFQCEDQKQQHYLIQILTSDLGNLSYNTGLPL